MYCLQQWYGLADDPIPLDVPADVSVSSRAPPPGGTNLMFITFPPDAVMMSPGFDPAAAGAEYMQVLPGLAEKFEMDHPGMHTTDSATTVC